MTDKTSRWSFSNLFRSRKPPLPTTTRVSNPYHAVSILPGKAACPAAYRLSGLRFLSRHAPRLPLPSCDSEQCSCRFKHHQDRRAGPRRRSDQGMMEGLWNGTERRRSPGRRAEDR
jgi:hypothetical protein